MVNGHSWIAEASNVTPLSVPEELLNWGKGVSKYEWIQRKYREGNLGK
jgi:hypothetical protein